MAGCFEDKYCIVTRYPDGLLGLSPADYFDKTEASESMAQSAKILDFVKVKLEGLRDGKDKPDGK